MRVVGWSAGLLMLSLLGACGSSSGAAVDAAGVPSAAPNSTALPAAQLLTGTPTVTPEPGGTSALLVAHTSKNADCRVYYGRTPAATDGWATDASMGSDGHTTHQAEMLGLQPATTYYYRFVGTADGQQYAGAGGTFRTAAAPSLPAGKNLALGAKVTAVSSEYSAKYAGANAIDGNPATEWSSAGDGDHASITIDLGRVSNVTGIGFRTRQMSDGTSIVTAIEVVVDGHRYGPFKTTPGLSMIPLHTRGRVVRIAVVHSTGGNTGAQDIAIYGN
jgi:hypothetical protein